MNSPEKPRKPWLTAILSLFNVPLGQIYAGRQSDGISPLYVNS
ncbi:MAG TPA: hypothetical protein VGM64_17090 [Lacunisphaera sp.]